MNAPAASAAADPVTIRSGTARFLARRIGLGVLTLLAISLITFLATNALPGDPARSAFGILYTEDRAQAYEEAQGLDKPVLERYIYWLGNALTLDLGESLTTKASVASQVGPRALRTVTIGLIGVALAIPIAFLLGMYAAERDGRPSEGILSTVFVLLASVPEFVVGVLLLIVFAIQLGILPVSSTAVATGTPDQVVLASVLPVMTLTLITVPYFYRLVRATVRDTLTRPYVRAARVRGISPGRLRWQHVLPNAIVPLLGAGALATADIVGGLIVIETVFNFPGIGQLLVDSTTSGDIPVVQATVFVFALGYIILNLAADTLMLMLNPRLRDQARQ